MNAGADSDITWLYMDPIDALGETEPSLLSEVAGGTSLTDLARWATRLPSPVGSEENSIPHRIRETWQQYVMWSARKELRVRAKIRAGQILAELLRRGDAVYRVEAKHHKIVLVGISGKTK